MNKNILFIVDPQNDFLDDGALPVEGSTNRMLALANYLSTIDTNTYDTIVVSCDWHPSNHCSFKENGGEWPTHCVKFTYGALPYDPLMRSLKRWMNLNKVEFITKGIFVNEDQYSCVNDDSVNIVTGLCSYDDTVDIAGIVGTVCVKNTINGLISYNVVKPSNITALMPFIAQFPGDDDKFADWAKNVNINITNNINF